MPAPALAAGTGAAFTESSGGMPVQRVCFTLQVDPARLDEYRTRHADVWPEMLTALHNSGWRDYSLYLREDGLLVGVVETDDFAGAQAAMAKTDVNRRWRAEMAQFFPDLTDARPDQGMHVLDEVFNLEDQLQRTAKQTGDTR